ncbi:MAG: gliding motility-associated C-terminal domain-containing protein, partial [Cyclobacteriaceae bacterium]|nr:gliding motility-associated C-terminal domain-containing protein [Cyclobacteriaceae bacterium HetDA_MAG_MS6]
FNIEEDLDIPVLDEATIVANATNDEFCTGDNGTITINDADISGSDLSLYNISIESGSPGSGNHLGSSPYNGTALTSIVENGVAPGDYYITAVQITGECSTASIRVNISDVSFNPDIQLTSLSPNVNCSGGGTTIGGVTVTADNLTADADYQFQWYAGNSTGAPTVPAINGGNTFRIFDVAEGFYTVEVSRISTGCSETQTFEIPVEEEYPSITTFVTVEQTTCDDNGSVEITGATFQGGAVSVAQLLADYTINWYTDDNLSTPAVDNDPATPLILENVAAGSYFATITNDTTNCIDGFTAFEVDENIVLPVITVTQVQADSTCSPTGSTANGILVATVDGETDANTDYQFQWYSFTGNVRGGALDANDSLIGYYQGQYEIEVTRVSTGCVVSTSFELLNAPAEPEILTVSSTDPTFCTPANGVIEVTAVTKGTLADYTYEFFQGDPAGSGVTVQNSASASYTQAEANTPYFVRATHVATQCTTGLVEFNLNDENIIPPVISLAVDPLTGDPVFDFQTNCDSLGNPNGLFAVVADGSNDETRYTFRWEDAVGGVLAVNNDTLSPIAAGDYTVIVTDGVTGCVSSETFTMVNDIPNPIPLSISTSPNENCVNPNGKAAVSVISPRRSIIDYSYYWFNGELSNPDPLNADFEGQLYEDLAEGRYTVLVIDDVEPQCQSSVTFVDVPAGDPEQSWAIDIIRNQTVCFTDRPDGFVHVDSTRTEEYSQYTFEWYVGTWTTLADINGLTPVDSGLFADTLAINDYTLYALNNLTGCYTFNPFTIEDERPIIPAPTINALGNRTNCQVPDGDARANVQGETDNYLFTWYAQDDPTTPLFFGERIQTLDSITYIVIATQLSTGCESPESTVTIFNEIEDPVFSVITEGSLCLRTEDGSTNQFSGQAFIQFAESDFIESISWLDEEGRVVSNDRKFVDAAPGSYTVEFVSSNGCTYTDSFVITPAIKIYNGVSANDDGLNDFFLIDCIDLFPNNFVQIYDPNGTKLFEIENYNNLPNRRFNGVTNLGAGGKQVPTGTLFYVIDLGDGSPLFQGFFELVR